MFEVSVFMLKSLNVKSVDCCAYSVNEYFQIMKFMFLSNLNIVPKILFSSKMVKLGFFSKKKFGQNFAFQQRLKDRVE